MPPPVPHLRWSPASAPADAVLAAQVAEQVVAVASGPVAVGRLCGRCASSEHGRPWARIGSLEVPVSLSRSGDHLLTAVGEPGGGRVGVDLEQVDPARAWPLAEMLAPGEEVVDHVGAARLWATKEAILKVEGIGLDRAMSQVRVADFDGVLTYPPAPAGYVAVTASARQRG